MRRQAIPDLPPKFSRFSGAVQKEPEEVGQLLPGKAQLHELRRARRGLEPVHDRAELDRLLPPTASTVVIIEGGRF